MSNVLCTVPGMEYWWWGWLRWEWNIRQQKIERESTQIIRPKIGSTVQWCVHCVKGAMQLQLPVQRSCSVDVGSTQMYFLLIDYLGVQHGGEKTSTFRFCQFQKNRFVKGFWNLLMAHLVKGSRNLAPWKHITSSQSHHALYIARAYSTSKST